jgi:hypothetical protein
MPSTESECTLATRSIRQTRTPRGQIWAFERCSANALSDGRAESDQVLVWVDDGALVHPPLHVLRRRHFDTSRVPLGRHAVSIVNEQVGSATPAIVVGCDAEVKLDTVPKVKPCPPP